MLVWRGRGFVRASDASRNRNRGFSVIIMTGQKFELFESRNTKSALRNE